MVKDRACRCKCIDGCGMRLGFGIGNGIMTGCKPTRDHGDSNRQGFTAIYADGGICGIYPATRWDASDRQLCFTWCRLPRM
eukprot:1521946-Pleurochrysis_carterae.AAC.1